LLEQLGSTHNAKGLVCGRQHLGGGFDTGAGQVERRERESLRRPTRLPPGLLEPAGTWPSSRAKLPRCIAANDDTFNDFDSKQWAATVQHLNQVMTDWEQAVESAARKEIKSWCSAIARADTHNAYHIGQIVFVRRLQGSWHPEKGIK